MGENPKGVRCYVQFNPLVTHPINKLTFRQFNYAAYMKMKNHLARWMFKHLSHYYTQADWNMPYTIMQSTIVGPTAIWSITPARATRCAISARRSMS